MKQWYLSKTIWFNILTVGVAIIGNITQTLQLNAETTQIFGAVLAVGNTLLRFISTGAIGNPNSVANQMKAAAPNDQELNKLK